MLQKQHSERVHHVFLRDDPLRVWRLEVGSVPPLMRQRATSRPDLRAEAHRGDGARRRGVQPLHADRCQGSKAGKDSATSRRLVE